jgi:hypothetical protein
MFLKPGIDLAGKVREEWRPTTFSIKSGSGSDGSPRLYEA